MNKPDENKDVSKDSKIADGTICSEVINSIIVEVSAFKIDEKIRKSILQPGVDLHEADD